MKHFTVAVLAVILLAGISAYAEPRGEGKHNGRHGRTTCGEPRHESFGQPREHHGRGEARREPRHDPFCQPRNNHCGHYVPHVPLRDPFCRAQPHHYETDTYVSIGIGGGALGVSVVTPAPRAEVRLQEVPQHTRTVMQQVLLTDAYGQAQYDAYGQPQYVWQEVQVVVPRHTHRLHYEYRWNCGAWTSHFTGREACSLCD